MINWRSREERRQLWRYYQAGVINMAFGFGLYALLVTIGLDRYVSQLVSHVCGVIFNYFMYSRYTFSNREGAVRDFILSYAVNYVLSLMFLAAVSIVVPNAYLAGFLAAVIVSVINFFILRDLVFRREKE